MNKRGRPALADGEQTIRFTVSISEGEKRVLEHEAEKRGKSLARFLVERALFNLTLEIPAELNLADLKFLTEILKKVKTSVNTMTLLDLLRRYNEVKKTS